jgi:hypothetical protein
MDVIIGDLKVLPPDIGECYGIQSLIFEIDNLFTVHTDQMMMLVEFGLEPCNSTRMADLGDQP